MPDLDWTARGGRNSGQTAKAWLDWTGLLEAAETVGGEEQNSKRREK